MCRRSRGSPPARRVPLRARHLGPPVVVGSARRGTRPGGGNSAAPRQGRQRRGACPAHQSVRPRRHPASLFVDRARIGPANRHVPAQPGIAAGPPCAPTRAPIRPTGRRSARRVGAHDPAVATRLRRTGPATPGCVPGAPICPTAAAPRRVCSSTGHASGRRTGMCRRNRGSPPARRVPLRASLGPPVSSAAQRVGAHDPAVATRPRRDRPATPGCVPGRTNLSDRGGIRRVYSSTGHASGRRTGMCPAQPGIAAGPPCAPTRVATGRTGRRRPTRVGAHDPAVATRPRRDGPATPGCVPGAPISSNRGGTRRVYSSTGHASGRRTGIVSAQRRIAAGPPCAPTRRRRPTGRRRPSA